MTDDVALRLIASGLWLVLHHQTLSDHERAVDLPPTAKKRGRPRKGVTTLEGTLLSSHEDEDDIKGEPEAPHGSDDECQREVELRQLRPELRIQRADCRSSTGESERKIQRICN